MSYHTRRDIYSQIEALRERPLFLYVTSIRPNISAPMQVDVIPYIIKQIEQIDKKHNEIDFLIISNGGDPIAALRIINILKERFCKVNVLVPYVAYSAATVLALGADSIVMHPYSNLGPVDPQVTTINPRGERHAFSSEDVRNYIDFLKDDAGITDQVNISKALDTLTQEVGALSIGFSKKSQQLTLSLGRRLLEMHTTDKSKAEAIVNALCSSYYHHGYAVSRKEAKRIGLPIEAPQKELEDLMWKVWEDFNEEMHCSTAFDPIAETMNDPEVQKEINDVKVVTFPPGLDQGMVKQRMGAILNGIIPQPRKAHTIENLVVSCESCCKCYHIKQINDVLVWREPNLALNGNVTTRSKGWEEEK